MQLVSSQSPAYELVTTDGRVDHVDADTYELEGPLTTFFSTDGREVADSWSTRVMSVRTADVASIRRIRSASARAVEVA